MPSDDENETSAYRVFRQAIGEKKPVSFTYNGHTRKACPHVLGTKHGRAKAFVFQFAGTTATELPVRGHWRCLFVDEVTDARLVDGEWHAAAGIKRQTCVDEIDVEV